MMFLISRFFILCVICFPSFVFAATTTDFTINALVGDDMIPPTTPTLLTVIPIAPTQIDVTWSASTDNFLLSGYVLWRDGVAIATTTLTSFIDTGLAPETLYEYEVYAFDSFFNISTTSNALSTTTPAVPVLPPIATSTKTENTATIVFRLLSFDISPSTNSALFVWRTSMPARYTLRWGRSDAHDDGYIINDAYKTDQTTQISDLEPGTTYYYELTGYAANGRVLELRSGQFSTIARENLTPANVQNFTATTQGQDVRLSYDIPEAVVGGKVRIVRSYLGYPLDPYDGAVIYEGTSEAFLDEEAFGAYSTLYYAAFVISADGSVSSGALALARKPTTPTPGGINPDPTDQGTTEPGPSEEPIKEPIIEIPGFSFSTKSISLSQGANSFTFDTENIALSWSESFIISIAKDAIPDRLKSIIVTLIDPKNANKSYSFLLRINKEGTAYEAVIAPLLAVGPSRIQVEIFDYERSVVGRYRKAVTFVEGREIQGEVVFPDKLVKAVEPFFGTVSLLLTALMLLFIFLYRRSKAVEDNR